MNETIQASQNVAELLSRWPQVIPLFVRKKLSCVGCTMAPFETLADISKIYGFNLAVFLTEINQQILDNHPQQKES